MKAWEIVCVVIASDWTVMCLVGLHLTRVAKKAVLDGSEEVKTHIKTHLLGLVPTMMPLIVSAVVSAVQDELRARDKASVD